jgi:hypothetical protein
MPYLHVSAVTDPCSGVGHSAPYEDPGCYDLTVSYLFLSGSAKTPSPPLSLEPFSAREPRNDFELPWIMRALVDSVEVRGLFPAELKELKEGVIHWRPTTKALKEIKKRVSYLVLVPGLADPIDSSNRWQDDRVN